MITYSFSKNMYGKNSSFLSILAFFIIIFLNFAFLAHLGVAQDERHAFHDEPDSSMVEIPAGEFSMGSPSWTRGNWNDQRSHKVALDTFSIDRYEITNAQFKEFVETTGHRTEAEKEGWSTVLAEPTLETTRVKGANWQRPEGKDSVFSSDRALHPVVSISWKDANAYCEWKGKRLPTEAEWEYATRASTTTPYWWGDRGEKLVGNFADQTFVEVFPWEKIFEASEPGDWSVQNYQDSYVRTAPVGSFEPNPWGLYDMSGNVWEWVADWDHPGYDPKSEHRNPAGPPSGGQKIIRGGSWKDSIIAQRSASRAMHGPLTQSPIIGFRCAQDIVVTADTTLSSAPAEPLQLSTKSKPIAETQGHTPPDQEIPEEMSFVPSGKFWMGSYEGVGRSDEHPRHQVYLDAFVIDQFEVTVVHYAEFVGATGVAQPEEWDDTTISTYPRKPVVGVSWDEAQTYCQWKGKRLPTEAEWEKAAGGPDGQLFPWGDEAPHAEVVNRTVSYTDDLYREQLDVVGTYEDGKSPYGLYDMAGNADEWVADWYDANYYQKLIDNNPTGPERGTKKVVRSGSSLLKSRYLRSAKRSGVLPAEHLYTGFRCAQSIESPSVSSEQQPIVPPQEPPANNPSTTISSPDSTYDKIGSMVLLPAGEFIMGATSMDFATTGIPHPIHVAIGSFYLDQFEVTNEQFQQFIKASGFRTWAEKEGVAPVFVNSDTDVEEVQGANWNTPEGKEHVFSSGRKTHPVVSVSWDGAQAFCEWAGKRLPTEAEWEYAAKAGTSTPYWWGTELGTKKIVNVEDVTFNQAFPLTTEGFDKFEESSEFDDKPYDDGFARTAPVGSFPPNPWKLHDMLGNVSEWVADWENELSEETSILHQNPQGPSTGLDKVVRGGNWRGPIMDSASRYGEDPLGQTPDLGFRCAKDAGDTPSTDHVKRESFSSHISTLNLEESVSLQELPDVDAKAVPMVSIPQGTFSKLIPVFDDDPMTYDTTEVKRDVPVDAFSLDQYEVTNEQFATFVRTMDYQTKAEHVGYAWRYTDNGWKKQKQASWIRPQGEQSIIETQKEKHPVVSVSWDDANAFCEWAGKRLPTEAEWEYAARAGSPFETTVEAYQTLAHPESIGNFLDQSTEKEFPLSAGLGMTNDGVIRTAAVGSFQPNTWKLHDMFGNVWEWVANRDDTLYPSDAPDSNGMNVPPSHQDARIARGASWAEDRANDLWDNRLKVSAGLRTDAMGFRCASDVSQTATTEGPNHIIPKLTKQEEPKTLSNEDLVVTIEPQENLPEKLEAPMVLIPEGEFLMGATDQEWTYEQWHLGRDIPEDGLPAPGALDDIEFEEGEDFIPLPDSEEPLQPEGPDCQFDPEACELYQRTRPRHNVRLKAFYLDQYEVTNTQFHAFIQATQYKTRGEQEGKAFGYTDNHETWGEDIQEASWQRPEGMGSVFDSDRGSHPVVSVSWTEAQAYCEWSGKRLPTEAEWEYAARGGTDTQFWWGNAYPESTKRGNFSDQATQWKNLSLPYSDTYNDEFPRTAPVGSFKPNPWELYDMTGNVQEWVSNWYGNYSNSKNSGLSPSGPQDGHLKVARGNSWASVDLSLAGRFPMNPMYISADLGFRCAQNFEASHSAGESTTDALPPSTTVEIPVQSEEESPEDAIDSGPEEEASTFPEPTEAEANPGMVLITSGRFVEIAINEFFLDKFEVSNQDFQEFVKTTGYRTTAERVLGGDVFVSNGFENYLGVFWREPEGLSLFTPDEKTSVFDTGRAEHPVSLVSWNDAHSYCEWSGKRLPTEAEWEYAARSGTQTVFWWGDKLPESKHVGNFADETHQRAFPKRRLPIVEKYTDEFARTAPIGSFTPNPWGLYDIVGNVAEWVSDQDDRSVQQRTKVTRGGSWASIPDALQSGAREILLSTTAKASIGFRCASDAQGGT